ncbi:unnamed protein product [Didymodactylos carnosus]|uniref:Uncharacterized protein n=1 Tax=Didymodactylos carnosus TaxID=1234261 RepID=A0A815ADH3_9BILA|nr:unnamed protein product [Didymodactylos carnosus]CAF4027228.1 unnamed protein product [Didymodactylos carnosus]
MNFPRGTLYLIAIFQLITGSNELFAGGGGTGGGGASMGGGGGLGGAGGMSSAGLGGGSKPSGGIGAGPIIGAPSIGTGVGGDSKPSGGFGAGPIFRTPSIGTGFPLFTGAGAGSVGRKSHFSFAAPPSSISQTSGTFGADSNGLLQQRNVGALGATGLNHDLITQDGASEARKTHFTWGKPAPSTGFIARLKDAAVKVGIMKPDPPLKKFAYTHAKPELTHIYNQPITSLQEFRRPLDGTGGQAFHDVGNRIQKELDSWGGEHGNWIRRNLPSNVS